MTNDELRAQANAQPVAVVPAKWTERHTSAQTWIEDADQAHDLRLYVSGIMESHDQRIAYAQEIARRLNAVPGAPQAEPKRPAFLDEIDRAKEHVASWPQWMKDATVSAAATLPVTEPKREPLPGLAPTHRCPACGALWRQCDDASWNLRSALCCGLCDAGRVELVRLLDEPKREPLSDWRIGELYRQWLANPETVTITDLMRAVERAHGIGGSLQRNSNERPRSKAGNGSRDAACRTARFAYTEVGARTRGGT